MRTIICLFLLITIGILPAFCQDVTFGKNKVQYKNFEWYFIQSTHFDVYFSQGGDYLAQFTADIAESAYTSISKSFRYQIFNRVTIIVYNSHNDFQQTNVVYEYLEEGIGGVTELFKNRVVVPFEGDYKKFRHVIHHELVHAVINDMFYGGSIQSIITKNITLQLPMWFNEGLAEYEALKWDTDSDMFLRDVTVHEDLRPIDYLDGYYAYRCGQSVWNYVATKYGEQKISEILLRIRGMRSVDQGFRSAIGLDIKELSEKWQKEQKILYWPDIAKREDPVDFARRLTDHSKDQNFYNTSPSISPQGDKIAFISDRDDYFDVFIMSTIDGSIQKKVVDGQRTADFEELHLLTPGMAWSPDGSQIALAAKSGDQDAIIIIDVKTKKEEKIELGFDGIFSIDWSPVADSSKHHKGKLAFVGLDKGHSDIYLYDLDSKSLTNLTQDIFTDADPAWSSDGKIIYFVSNRGEYLNRSDINPKFKMQNYNLNMQDIYSIEISSLKITRVTNLPNSNETSPCAAPDGKHLLFISDMNGINNIYVKNLETGIVKPLTNSLSGIYQLSLSRDGNKLAFCSLIKSGFDIFILRSPLDRDIKLAELEATEYFKRLTAKTKYTAEERPDTGYIRFSDEIIIKPDIKDTTDRYNENFNADYRHYIFDDAFRNKSIKAKDTTKSIFITNNTDEYGNYKINKYKLNFSPDIIYGNAGYNTFYGIQGSTIMAFSDMMGDHQIYFMTNLQFDLKNSDYALAYLYLPKRIDYAIEGFHSARFIYLDDQFGTSLYRFRNYGITGMASLPLSKFNRVEFNLSWFNLTRENLDYTNVPIQRRQLVVPSLGYIHDTSLWGLISPTNGVRYNLNIMGSPKINSEALSFYTLTADYRKYFRLWKNFYTLALRFAAGGSYGKNPQWFIIGGVDNWVNRQFENNQIPIKNVEDFVFLTSGIPLRGYNYNARFGTKYGLMNTEFRFPFFGYVAAGPLPVFLQSFSGILFLDIGSAWDSRKSFKAFDKDPDGKTYMRDILSGTGYGVRMILLGFLVKMDVAWSFNLQASSHPKYYFSLGADF